MGAVSWRGPSLLQNAMGTQFNIATMVGHWQLVLDLIEAGIEPGLPHKISCRRQTSPPFCHPAGQEQYPFS